MFLFSPKQRFFSFIPRKMLSFIFPHATTIYFSADNGCFLFLHRQELFFYFFPDMVCFIISVPRKGSFIFPQKTIYLYPQTIAVFIYFFPRQQFFIYFVLYNCRIEFTPDNIYFLIIPRKQLYLYFSPQNGCVHDHLRFEQQRYFNGQFFISLY